MDVTYSETENVVTEPFFIKIKGLRFPLKEKLQPTLICFSNRTRVSRQGPGFRQQPSYC